MDISLPPELEQFVHAAIQSQAYTSPSDMVCRALDLLRQSDEALLARRDEINAMIEEGLRDLDAGHSSPADEVFRELRQELRRPQSA